MKRVLILFRASLKVRPVRAPVLQRRGIFADSCRPRAHTGRLDRVFKFALWQKMRRTVIALGLLLVLALAGWLAVDFVPLPAELFAPTPTSFDFVDRHGLPLRRARQETQDYHAYVPLREVPQALIPATIAAEDQRFWEHHGVDGRATLRAA